MAWSSLNQKSFKRDSEFMFQAYYQAHITHATFFEPAISYIPDPAGARPPHPNFDAALALTFRVIALF
jgi:porin